jgi:hypothetical protein
MALMSAGRLSPNYPQPPIVKHPCASATPLLDVNYIIQQRRQLWHT